MENKHTWKIFLFYILMYISTLGKLVEVYARAGQELGLAYLIAFANLLFVSIVMMAIPFLCRIIKKESYRTRAEKYSAYWIAFFFFSYPSFYSTIL